jgi:hypothetical protein
VCPARRRSGSIPPASGRPASPSLESLGLQPDTVFVGHETVVAKVIVGVVDENVEDHASKQQYAVQAVSAPRDCNKSISSRCQLMDSGTKDVLERGVSATRRCLAIFDPAGPRPVSRDPLDFIVLARKLRNHQMTMLIPNGGLRPRAAKGKTGREEQPQIFLRVGLRHDMFSSREQSRQFLTVTTDSEDICFH